MKQLFYVMLFASSLVIYNQFVAIFQLTGAINNRTEYIERYNNAMELVRASDPKCIADLEFYTTIKNKGDL